jgi:Methyltransferase domain
MFNEILFPQVIEENWQMMTWERIGLTGVLSRIQAKGAIEVGVYYGGSLSLTSQYVEKIIAIDIDPNVTRRFVKPDNAEIWIAPSVDAIPKAFTRFNELKMPVNFILVDADHSASAVKRDLELILQYQPTEPLFIMMHDSGNQETRRGILSVDWEKNRFLQFVELDFIPGQIIEHTVKGSRGEVWGGLALAFLHPILRQGSPEIRQSALTSIRSLHYCSSNLSILDQK